jgi:hypothetical protein
MILTIVVCYWTRPTWTVTKAMFRALDALFSNGYLILCDMLNHDSCVPGLTSSATILPLLHNSTEAPERTLSSICLRHRRELIVAEAVYSMCVDIPNELDETGHKLCEYSGVDPEQVDVSIGTISILQKARCRACVLNRVLLVPRAGSELERITHH